MPKYFYAGSNPEAWWESLHYEERLNVVRDVSGALFNWPTKVWENLSDEQRLRLMVDYQGKSVLP
jgi:hypothetical protein